MQLDNNSLIMQWNTDTNGNPVSKHIPREVQQVSPTHNLIQLTQIPDEFYPLRIVTEDNIELREVKYRNEMSEETFRVDYGMGLVYFHESLKGKMVIINYYGRGVMLISDSRIFHKNGDTIVDTWDNILERSQDALDLIEHAGGLANAIKVINQKVDEGTKVADRIENFITETQFYGYTITLSREAFVVKADDNGEVGKTETSSVYTDVLVYKGAKQIIPTLTVSNEYGCAFKVEGQRVKLTSIDVNLIKVNAILNIDCGDGLVAQRVLEVTKVFDGVSQYEVSMTNPFYSFQANSEGYIEESQSIECTFKVSKANIDYENYTVQIQNLPQGLNYEIKKGSIVFTAISGRLLPSYGSCSVVLTIDGQSFNKPFTWNKVKQGQDAKSLTLVGNQIIRYEQPDFSDIPLYSKVTVSAKVAGLSGTPTWSFYNGVEWVVLENETALDLTFTHNDELIWADRKEVTIKCQMEEFHDELTIVKLASGVNGNDAITVVLTNESHTVSIDDSGFVATAEIENTRTNVLAYKGANSVTPKITRGNCVGCDVSIAGNTVQLLSLDNSFTSSTAELLVDVDGVIITKIWTISKSKQGLQGENGQNGKTYILNVTGGTRSVTYSQINHDPRPAYSFAFTGSLYENGVEIIENVSWYWVANGHFEGSSVTKRFTPTIKKVFDETVINNSISVMATYNGQTLTQDIPLSVTKDAYGLDWVSEWDSTKVDVRGNLILTPKIFAGHYDQENDLITGVAIGKDVLNNGRTVGVVGYQNNVPSFLLDTDGSLQVGNPFGEDSTGLYYNDGVFKLKVNELSIEGAKVPTENEIGNLVASEINSAKNELQETINGLNNSLVSLEDVVNNSLQDGILTEVEKHSLKTVIDTINGEVNTVVAQSNSILINPYLSNTALMLKLEELLGNYEATHNTLVETYVRITNSDIPTDEDIALFNTTLSDLRVISDELNQVLIDCLTNISQTQAQQLVEKAKEEIQAEVSDVNDALSDLENTINTDFKAGLVTSINIANLENHLRQLAKEKADLDAQYNVIYNNTKLSNSIKSKLLQAKSDYDIAHDTLVAKIETSIADNLMTEAELQEINRLITVYTQKLATYSGVAQESNADIALNSAQAVVEALDQEAIFNKLTNNGEVQGLYLQNGKVYINGEYVNTRNLRAVRNDGTETFKVDSEGNVSIKAKSFILTSDAETNVATEEYVNSAVSQVSNGAINIILSNESQVISTNANSVPLANQSFAIKVQMYKSTNEVTDFTIGTVSSVNGITASVSQTTKTVTFSVSTSTTIGAVSGKITIPIVYNGKTYNKEWSWAIAKQGNSGTSGSAGADAKYVTVSGEQVFKYTNNFTGTPTPSSITLTANVYNTTSTGKWQYSNGSSWVDCGVTAKTLTVQPTSYTLSSLKRVTVRYIVNNVYDTLTVVAVSDGANGVDGQDGINGKDGADGTSSYFYVRYSANSNGSSMTTSPTSTSKYMGVCSTTSTTAPTDYTKYTWTLIKGADGQDGSAGAKGEDGKTSYLHIKYSNDGKTFTSNNGEDIGIYIGTYVDFNQADSNIFNDYTWKKFVGEDGQDGKDGADAITIVLTNENHTFSANSSGNITSAQSTSTNIVAYKGVSAATVTIGTLPTVTGLTLSKSGSTVTIQANTGTSLADSGTISIPITVDGKSFTKNFSWTKVKAGATGAAGTSAKAVDIIASSMIFKSTDGGTTFSPNTITLTPKLQNLTYSSWQYSTNGGSSWTTASSGSNGLTIASGVLTISKDSPLYTTTVTSLCFRLNTNDSAYYDIVTIVKLYDVADVDFDKIAQDKVDDYDNTLNQQKVFNKLTNNGQTQGIYLENSKLYINGEYIKAKSISGDKISAGVITATNGKSTINLDNGAMNLGNTTDASYLQWTGSDLNIKAKSLSIGATSVATTTDVNNATSGKVDKNQIISSINQTAEAVKINANKIELTGEVVANAINGGSTTINGSKITTGTITANQINTKTLTADMITSGTFKGTSFLAGGSTNGEGYIQVLDASNSIKMIASKNGIFATSIQFPESITISGAVKTNGVIEANGTGFHSSFRETGTNYTINYQAQLIEGALSVTQESDFGGSSSLSTIKITGNRININGVLLQNKGANLQLNCPLRIVGSGSVDKRVATVTSLGTVYLGDETTDTSVLSKNAPNWWNGSTFRELLHTGGGQTISGGNLGISAGGLNVGTGTNTEGYTISNNRNINNVHHRASLSVYNTDNGIASLFYRNMSTSIEKGVGVKASSSTSGYFIPSHNNQLSCGTASYKWTYIYATNGTIQTSDERFKIKRGYADTNDCYDMVKNTQLYNYTMLGENKENLSQNRLGKLAMARNEDETNVHIGVMAQDLQNYECGKKILVEGEYEKQDGTKDTMLHINPLDMSMAILGGLQKEIQIRDEQYEELKQENETLKNELAEIKRMLMAQTLI